MKEDRRFGAEIEFVYKSNKNYYSVETALVERGITVEDISQAHDTDYQVWTLVEDGSIVGDGIEVRSRILQGEVGRDELSAGFEAVAENGAVNTSCGFHIHVDAEDLDPRGAWRLLHSYSNLQPVINSILPWSRIGNNYCKLMDAYALEHHNRNGEGCFPQSGDRYYAVNLEAFNSHNTIEFRQHSGTVDKHKGLPWMDFCVGLYEATVAEGCLIMPQDAPSIGELAMYLGLSKSTIDYFVRRAEFFAPIHQEERE